MRNNLSSKFSGTTLNAAPLWMAAQPQSSLVFIYDALGSAYTNVESDGDLFSSIVGLGDGGTLGGTLNTSLGNGMEYYDGFIYFAKNTSIARYGDLSEGPAFAGNYWGEALGMTPLFHPEYNGNTEIVWPRSNNNPYLRYPNHMMKRHSDGRLYIADMQRTESGRKQGVLHYIQTNDGSDTGSRYNALRFGESQMPTAIESYGTDLAIALYEGTGAPLRQSRAKIAFWDTVSANYNRLVFWEFPDQIITAMKNVNGTLYVVSGNLRARGFRVSHLVSGYTFKEDFYSETGEPCFPGAIDNVLNRIFIGSHTRVPVSNGCVYGVGLQKQVLGHGFFNIQAISANNASTIVTALAAVQHDTASGTITPIVGWSNGSGTSANGLDKQGTPTADVFQYFWSLPFRIGQPFKIKRVHLSFPDITETGTSGVRPSIYVDHGFRQFNGPVINVTNYPELDTTTTELKNVNWRLDDGVGQDHFWLELRWGTVNEVPVSLPIRIEYELLEQEE